MGDSGWWVTRGGGWQQVVGDSGQWVTVGGVVNAYSAVVSFLEKNPTKRNI